MTKRDIVIIVLNLALAAGAFALVGLGKLSWELASAFIVGLGFPSVLSIGKPPPPPGGPPAVLLLAVLAAGLFLGCAALTSKPAKYEARLIECNQLSRTLDESIACENDVRAEFHRPLRDAGVRAEGGAK